MGAILEVLAILSKPNNVGFASLFLTVVGVIYFYLTRITYPSDLPRSGEKEGATRFSLKTRLAYYTDCMNLYREAYEKYGRQGRTCLLPGLGFANEIIIANTSVPWLIAQPDHVLSLWAGFVELDQVKHTLWDSHFVLDPWQGQVVKRDVTTQMEHTITLLEDEMKVAVESHLGSDTKSWKDISLHRTIQEIIGQSNGRFTVGLPLCRDKEYINHHIAFPESFIGAAGMTTMLPRVLRPILGPLIGIPLRYKFWQIKNNFRSTFNERLALMQQPKAEQPRDHLQMLMQFAKDHRPNELTLTGMTPRLAMANFGSFHQSAIAATNLILNVLDSDKQHNTIAILREEFTSVLAAAGGIWSKATAAKMVRADSVCRETLRVHAFGNRSLIRKVMVDDLTTEDGILLPKGALVSVVGHPAQCDADIFTDPTTFDPWRFSRLREATSEGGEKSTLVSLGPQNLAFGMGRHACPGRFLLEIELKMVLVEFFGKYDVELHSECGGRRPENKWLAEAQFPPGKARIRVRRRES